ncbi:hypothetical protein BURMUCGD2M_4460 [Burkholderia multivorans CGD2M]|uniref:Uncharacterized protein n=1 Tax=Burkholderia multivorans CGD2 TaxID=513052 RepID=B9BH36_9BURK|nr:hypothetical protein BURMUCGD2_4472 [Burkholderia multivorans CGD2]EEE15018.1 hypothetical protein BURMUCGD2M_4460 [Burkholderia multivorans CGD2M]
MRRNSTRLEILFLGQRDVNVTRVCRDQAVRAYRAAQARGRRRVHSAI